MIIDDEEGIRLSLRGILEDEGYAVEEASSAEEGLQKAEASPPDMIFLDIWLPGMDGMVLNRLFPYYDCVIIEAFGVGGLPEYGRTPFYPEIRRWIDAGKLVMMATQVTHEGSDMEVYQVGKAIKEEFHLMETYDMTLEATVTKVMWALGQTKEPERFRRLFYETINHDILLKEL